eukprot:NODE_2361_length_587_cov_74.184783_g2311_i0.p1 GENE.NODE_2361_length_587_cov_74.184783_g2311_i0~~NODE_2361_length_587_cov_74.184783_g2311_i0.p1  ORF type:complete len:127 (-),score=19.59 NODE_2361_length_587_cov_74.184783_g2311_i0:48-428(-)
MSIFFVRYGQDKKAVFNAACSNVIVLNHIKTQLAAPYDTVDLISLNLTEKNLNALGLYSKPMASAADDIQVRGVYCLIGVEEDEFGAHVYTPFLEGDDATKLKGILDARTADERKKLGGAKGGKKK